MDAHAALVRRSAWQRHPVLLSSVRSGRTLRAPHRCARSHLVFGERACSPARCRPRPTTLDARTTLAVQLRGSPTAKPRQRSASASPPVFQRSSQISDGRELPGSGSPEGRPGIDTAGLTSIPSACSPIRTPTRARRGGRGSKRGTHFRQHRAWHCFRSSTGRPRRRRRRGQGLKSFVTRLESFRNPAR